MWQFVIWAIATLVAYALQPKPPKQKPPSLEDFDIPTAEAGRPVPAVFGEVTVTGPNVIWYGDYEVQTETEDGIKRRFYKMGLHFAICYGPADELQKIIAGERVAWGDGNLIDPENPQTTSGQIRIIAPNLFGGEDKEGGISGYADVMMGEATQAANSYLTTVQGAPQPAYRGIMTLVFRKGLVTANSTYVKPWAFKIKRIRKGWYNDACWYPQTAVIPNNDIGVESNTSALDLSQYPEWCVETFAYGGEDIGYLSVLIGRRRNDSDIWSTPDPYQFHIRTGNLAEGFPLIARIFFSDNTWAEVGSVPRATWAGSWFHVALDKRGDVVTFFFNGSDYGSYNMAGKTLRSDADLIDAPGITVATYLGHECQDMPFGWNNWQGGFDETRVSKCSRYSSGSVPTSAFKRDAYTVLLIHYDGAQGSTKLTDASSFGHTCTMVAGCLDSNSVFGSAAWYDNNASGYDNSGIRVDGGAGVDDGGDMNPAHIIYQAITDPAWGMGYPASCIKESSFIAAADLFYAERMGLSLIWNQQSKTEEFIQEILNHCGAILGVDPETGQFILTPLRGDYDVNTLDVYDETKIVSIEQFERAGYGELVGEVCVVYRDKENNKDRTVTVQNLAVIQSQSGVVSETARYPGISKHGLASRVAMRDLKSRSVPLGRGKMRVDRNAWDIIPGGVFKLSWAKLGLTEIICRVLEVNTGTLTDGTITVTFSEDVFGLDDSTYAIEQSTGWTQPSFVAEAVSNQTLIETPYWWLTGALGSAETAALPSTATYVYPLAQKPQDMAEGFDLWSRIDVGSPQNDYVKVHSNGEFVATARLQSQDSPEADISQSATTLYITSSTLEDFAAVGDLIQIGTGVTAEIVRLTGGDLTTYITVTRGHLDTTPQLHAHNTLMWLLPQSDLIDETQYVSGEVVDAKLLTITGSNVLSINDATEATITLGGRQNKPISAGNVKINGLAWPTTIDVEGSPAVGTCAVTWEHRNRATHTDVTLQTDTGIASESGVVYNVTVYDNDTDEVIDSASILTGTSWDASLSGIRSARLELETARDLGDSPSTYLAAWQRQVRYFSLIAPVPETDPYWSSVSLLMHMDDEGSPTWRDASTYNHSADPKGNVQISTAQSVFGGASALFDGTGDYLRIADHTSFDFGSGDFTIEFRYRTTTVAAGAAIMERRGAFNATGWSIRRDGAAPTKMNFACGDNNASAWEVNITGTTTLSANTWYAVAITRSGSSFKLFVDGNVDGSATWAGTIGTAAATARLLIGVYYDLSGGHNGYIDELRITKGVARYTAAYTIAATPFPETA